MYHGWVSHEDRLVFQFDGEGGGRGNGDASICGWVGYEERGYDIAPKYIGEESDFAVDWFQPWYFVNRDCVANGYEKPLGRCKPQTEG